MLFLSIINNYYIRLARRRRNFLGFEHCFIHSVLGLLAKSKRFLQNRLQNAPELLKASPTRSFKQEMGSASGPGTTSARPTTSLSTKERLQATVRGLGPNHPHDHGTTKQKHYRHTLRERSEETTAPMRVKDLNPSNLARRAARHLSFRRPCSRSPQPRRYLTVCYCWPVPPTRVCARERQ